jgi:hypothetical protein
MSSVNTEYFNGHRFAGNSSVDQSPFERLDQVLAFLWADAE